MSDTGRLVVAASALSTLLNASGVPHAFFGSILTALLADQVQCDEIYCVVEGGQAKTHPFRLVRDALAESEDFTLTHSPWSNRLHVVYRSLIPAIEIEILPSGETGPRRLDKTTVMTVQDLPFLTISEFIRAKLTAWIIRRLENDAQDICYLMRRYWNHVDINRIPEHEMNLFAKRVPQAAPAWSAIRRKYGM